jgi:hypothetical protein
VANRVAEMAKTIGRLTVLQVQHAKKPGMLADGDGLYLQVNGAGARSWIFRFTLEGKSREMGGRLCARPRVFCGPRWLRPSLASESRRVSCPFLASANPQACRSMCGCIAARARHHPGEASRSERRPSLGSETNGDFGYCSRWSRRRARNSSSRNRCVHGVPCFTRRTCSLAALKSA